MSYHRICDKVSIKAVLQYKTIMKSNVVISAIHIKLEQRQADEPELIKIKKKESCTLRFEDTIYYKNHTHAQFKAGEN